MAVKPRRSTLAILVCAMVLTTLVMNKYTNSGNTPASTTRTKNSIDVNRAKTKTDLISEETNRRIKEFEDLKKSIQMIQDPVVPVDSDKTSDGDRRDGTSKHHRGDGTSDGDRRDGTSKHHKGDGTSDGDRRDGTSKNHKGDGTSLVKQPEESPFRNILQKTALDQVVILGMVDTGYVDMALNFYITSIQPFDITNMLFVSVEANTCLEMHRRGLPCFTFTNQTYKKGGFGTQSFLDKMTARTNYIYLALQWGYSILQVDLDVVFLKNPLNAFTCSDCAVEGLQEHVKNWINCGFVMLKARPELVNVYKHMAEKAANMSMSDDQADLNIFVRKLKVKFRVLDKDMFVCGLEYYEIPKRYFVDTAPACPQCVVVHNNFIVTNPAKIYRFKEMGQWMVDGDGYFSNEAARYISYSNPHRPNNHQHPSDRDVDALKTALFIAQVLNRTLILPKFHCRWETGKPGNRNKTKHNSTEVCPLNEFLRVSSFDGSFQYREHSFLRHPLVPSQIKSGLSASMQIIPAEKHMSDTQTTEKNVFKYDKSNGLTEKNILDWFGNNALPVLVFESLHIDKLDNYPDTHKQQEFDKKLKAGFKMAKYRQFGS